MEDLEFLFGVLASEYELIMKFHKEYEELNVWLTDTRSMLEVIPSPSHSTGGGGMGMGGASASPALLRGKHHVRTGWVGGCGCVKLRLAFSLLRIRMLVVSEFCGLFVSVVT